MLSLGKQVLQSSFCQGGFDSPFEEAVASSLRDMGFEVDTQVGSAGFRIDLAVKHPKWPGTYLCAIECDGANYHSSRSARERDLLRQNILEALGWEFIRLWSTDWFKRPARELEKLRGLLERLVAQSPLSAEPAPEQSTVATVIEETVTPPEADEPVKPHDPSRTPPYIEADFPIADARKPHEFSVVEMTTIVVRVVELEGPIHEEEIARRIARLCGKERTGARIVEIV